MDMAAGRATRHRPKLSLNTSGVTDILSFKPSSLRLDTLSVMSPTSRNTFHNKYNSNSIQSPHPREQYYCDSRTTTPKDSALSPPKSRFSAMEQSSADHFSHSGMPAPQNKRQMLQPTSDTHGPSTRGILRPVSTSCERPRSRQRKSVAFRTELTETIQNNTYVLAHSDLLSATDSDNATPVLPSPSFLLPQRSKPSPRSEALGRRENKNESRWRAAIKAIEADDSDDCLHLPNKRASPTEDGRDGSQSDDSTSDSKRRKMPPGHEMEAVRAVVS